MSGPRILISDPLDPVCGEILKKRGVQFDQLKLTKEQLLTAIKVGQNFRNLNTLNTYLNFFLI